MTPAPSTSEHYNFEREYTRNLTTTSTKRTRTPSPPPYSEEPPAQRARRTEAPRLTQAPRPLGLVPAYTRQELTVLAHAQQDLTLPPTPFSDLSAEAQLRFCVLLQQRVFTDQHPVHPYFLRRVRTHIQFPVFHLLTPNAQAALRELNTSTTAFQQIQRFEYSFLAQRNLIAVPYPTTVLFNNA